MPSLNTLILRSFVLLFVATGFLASPCSAWAQTPAVLEEIKLITEDDQQAAFILRFSPEQPPVERANTSASAITLVARNSFRAPRVATRTPYRGLVRMVEFQQDKANLVLRLSTAAPARAIIEPAEANVIQIRIVKATGADPGSRQALPETSPAAPLPAAGAIARERGVDGDGYAMIFLHYADVSEVIGLLGEGAGIEPNNVFIRREPGFGSLGSSNQSTFTAHPVQDNKPANPMGQAFPNGLGVDRRLNAIWVAGTPERIRRIREQIALIDVPVDSVILETQFVELTESGARNLGIDLTNNAGQIAVGRLETGTFLPFNVNPNDVLPSGALQAAIYAQVDKGEGRILSRPRIAAQSGSTAKIITGDALPILTAITLSGVNGVSQQVQYVNVGVTLQIAPRVSADGFVTSQIYGVVSSVTGYSQGYPTISQREAETSASVRDGETFVIGGLTQENAITRKSRVPIVGDIPIAGALFRQERTTRSKTELYIVITPRIVRHRRFAEAESAPEKPPAQAAP